jgi:hypothetical protein
MVRCLRGQFARWPTRLAIALVVTSINQVTAPLFAVAQSTLMTESPEVCSEPNDQIDQACPLVPSGSGTTIQSAFNGPTDVDFYAFATPAPGVQTHLTLSDLWLDGALQLYDGQGSLIEHSDRHGSAQGQLSAPEVIVRWLEPGNYSLAVVSGAADWGRSTARTYSLRVAFGPSPAIPAGPGPYPAAAGGYQLSLGIEPSEPRNVSLVTFTATIGPPFTDLFDFSWSLDGQPFGENLNVVQLPRPSSGSHVVTVVAHGARRYPDPSRPELPPNLSVTGQFSVP